MKPLAAHAKIGCYKSVSVFRSFCRVFYLRIDIKKPTEKEMEERISDVEDMIEEMTTVVKENVKSKNILAPYIKEIFDTMKRPNLKILGMEEEEEIQVKGLKNIFSKIIKKSLIKTRRGPTKVEAAYRTPHI